MKVLIFEDEKHTVTRLIQLLKKCDSDIKVLEVIGSVNDGIQWFKNNASPDLIFQDIHLNDGNCFQLYDQIKVDAPIIFTTAYNEYALRSFKLNSIAYLVKPYDFNDIKSALDKFHKFKELFLTPEKAILKKLLQDNIPQTKNRFLVKIGDRYQSVKSADIAWFVHDEGVTFACTFSENKFPVNNSIDQLSAILDSGIFIRINRKYIINIECIEKIHTWFNSRLKLDIKPQPREELVVSRERVKAFKKWLDQ